MQEFSIVDYVIFGLLLTISAGIGVFYGCFGKKHTTSRELLIANREMGLFPASMSLLASFMSGITILGNPAEAYNYGTLFLWGAVAHLFVAIVVAVFFIPLFLNLDVTSAYQYLEMRFNKYVRLMASLFFILQMTVYMALVLYAPALALNQVTGFNTWILVISIGTVCTFYTTIGGMKAVMWTDAFQIVIMLVGLLAALIKGIISVGGVGKIIEINSKFGRIEFFEFDLDPTVRHTVWGLTIGLFFQWLSVYGVNQSQVQRYLSVPSVKIARGALFINLIGLWIILFLTISIGLVLFAYYKDCDPILNKQVKSGEQLFPLFVVQILRSTIGLPGLFLACLFSAALSTISTGLNSLATVVLEDVIKIFMCKNLSDKTQTLVSKLLCIGFGVLCLVLTYLVSFLGPLLQAAISLFGITGGPILGLFILGLFVPFANSTGAILGTITSLGINMWLFVGFNVYDIKYPKKDMFTTGCNRTGSTLFYSNSYQAYSQSVFKSNLNIIKQKKGFERFYSISYTWYGLIAVLVVCVVGSLISLIGKRKVTRNRQNQAMLQINITEWIKDLLKM